VTQAHRSSQEHDEEARHLAAGGPRNSRRGGDARQRPAKPIEDDTAQPGKSAEILRQLPLVIQLRQHIKRSGAGPDGRLFRSDNGYPLQPST
jgi:hypothetical protein